MKKALVLILTAFLFVSLFFSCGPEPIWEIIAKYDGNGSTSGTMEKQTVVKGEELTLSENKFEKSGGYQFVGWNSKSDGSGTMYPDGDTALFLEDITLYAQWNLEVVEIQFNKNGGEGTMYPQWAIKGKETTLRQNRFSKEDCHFIGWNTEIEGTGTWYSDSDTAAFESDTILYAQWEKDVVTIKFDANGGGGLMYPQWIKIGEETALKPNRFSWKDHVFIGWNTQKDGGGDKYDDKAKITADSDITLYAQWAIDIATMFNKYYWNEADSKYFTFSEDLNLSDTRIAVNGNVTLILPKGKTLSAGFGINVNSGFSLTIDGEGSLEAKGTSAVYAGIGGNSKSDGCGDITINGGNISVVGGLGGAGIGGAYDGEGGNITINGGTVEALGGSSDFFGFAGAAIGGGGKGAGGNVIINGGKVIATGRESSFGIGRGQNGVGNGKLTLGEGVSILVSDNGENWSPYEPDLRHRYMKTK